MPVCIMMWLVLTCWSQLGCTEGSTDRDPSLAFMSAGVAYYGQLEPHRALPSGSAVSVCVSELCLESQERASVLDAQVK